MAQGRDLSHAMQGGRIALKRRHGCVVGGDTIKQAVMINHNRKSISNFKVKICVEL